MAVESYGCWGPETQSNFSLFASHLAIGEKKMLMLQLHVEHGSLLVPCTQVV